MANDMTGNPWILDSTGVVSTIDPIRIKGIRWVAATTAGHAAILKDAAGRVVWHSVAAGANNVEGDALNNPPQGWNVHGLTVDTLASGKLYVEIL